MARNLRELENIIERTVLMCEGAYPEMEDFSMAGAQRYGGYSPHPFMSMGVDHKMGHYTGDRILSIANSCNNRACFSLLKFHHKVADVMINPCLLSLKKMEKNIIFQTLDHTNDNRTPAAKILDISVRTLRNKFNEYKEKMKIQ